jgi:signal transduction histidine kinase/ActR/RegA family two-component response regulator
MGNPSPQNAANWHDLAKTRAREVAVRAAISAVIAAGAGLIAKGAWPAIWLCATVVAQAVVLAIAEPAWRAPEFRFSALRQRLYYISAAIGVAIFAAAGPMLWFAGGPSGRLLAVIVLVGSALGASMQAGGSAKRLWAMCTPFVLTLEALPLVSLALARGEDRKVEALTALAVTLIALHLAWAGRSQLAASRELKQALQDAERERARAEAASRAKSDFLGVMSHELRTPLNGVLGMAQVLAADALTPPQRARLDVICQSGEHLLLLLNDLLDFSEIDTAKLELSHGLVDVASLAAQTETLFRPLAAGKALGLRLELAASAGPVRAGDPLRVRQVLHNLVGNAIKFTEAGEVRVRIAGDDDHLIFEVADTGPGVATEQHETVFEQFTQTDASSTRRYGGSGLGLAIARGLARLMGGDVSVRSAPGDGAVFTARLRLSRADVPVAAGSPPAGFAAEGPRLRVLAAEDNPTNQLVLKTLLEQVGVDVHVAIDGEAAVSAWRDGRWDLVLMDVQMPVMDGVAATREIRAIEAAERRPRTPIIAVTANAAAERVAEYVAAGMDGLCPKPIRLSQLLNSIEEAMDAAPPQEIAARPAA